MQKVREWYKSILANTSGSALLHTRPLAGAVEEGVAGYANGGALLYISGWRPGHNSERWV